MMLLNTPGMQTMNRKRNGPQPWTAQVAPLAKQGLSAKEIAERLGVKQVQVTRILKGTMRVAKDT
jgi:DNA-binding NarL/FixJ family response regulator